MRFFFFKLPPAGLARILVLAIVLVAQPAQARRKHNYLRPKQQPEASAPASNATDTLKEWNFRGGGYQNAPELNIHSQGGLARLFPNVPFNFDSMLGAEIQAKVIQDTSNSQIQSVEAKVSVEGVTMMIVNSIFLVGEVKKSPVNVAREVFLKSFSGGDERLSRSAEIPKIIAESFEKVIKNTDRWGFPEMVEAQMRNPDFVRKLVLGALSGIAEAEYDQRFQAGELPGVVKSEYVKNRLKDADPEAIEAKVIEISKMSPQEHKEIGDTIRAFFLLNFFTFEQLGSLPAIIRDVKPDGEMVTAIPFHYLLKSLGELIPLIRATPSSTRLSAPVDLFYTQEDLDVITRVAAERSTSTVRLNLRIKMHRADSKDPEVRDHFERHDLGLKDLDAAVAANPKAYQALVIDQLDTEIEIIPLGKNDQPLVMSDEQRDDYVQSLEAELGDIPLSKRLGRPVVLDSLNMAKLIAHSPMGAMGVFIFGLAADKVTPIVVDSTLNGMTKAMGLGAIACADQMCTASVQGGGALALSPCRILNKDQPMIRELLATIYPEPQEPGIMDQLRILSAHKGQKDLMAYLDELLKSMEVPKGEAYAPWATPLNTELKSEEKTP